MRMANFKIRSSLLETGLSKSQAWLSILLVWLGASCNSPRHPPTFADYKRADSKGEDSPESFDALLRVMKQAEFTSKEMEQISERGVVKEILGAATQAPFLNEMKLPLLKRATELSPSDPLPWMALASHHLSLLQNKITEHGSAQKFKVAIERAIALRPDNAFPGYLKAFGIGLSGDIAGARQQFLSAAQKPEFVTLEAELRQCVIAAAEVQAYSKYTARMMALGQTHDALFLLPLSRMMLTNSASDERVSKACLHMGQQLETSSRLFIETLVAFHIEREAWKHSNAALRVKANEEIDIKKKRITNAVVFLRSSAVKKLGERRMVQYLDTVFNKTEIEATEALASELGTGF
jgi:hypothetical protein